MWRRKSLEFVFGLYKVIKQIWGLELIYPEKSVGSLGELWDGTELGGGRYKSWEGSVALL